MSGVNQGESLHQPASQTRQLDPLNPHDVRVIDEAHEAEFYAQCYLAESSSDRGGCASFLVAVGGVLALAQQKLDTVAAFFLHPGAP